MSDRAVPGLRRRQEMRVAIRAAMRPTRLVVARGPWNFLLLVIAAGAFLGVFGRAWHPLVFLLVVAATTVAIVSLRWRDRWALPWLHLMGWVGQDNRERLSRELGVAPPEDLTLEWLETRPVGSVPDWIRAGALVLVGRLQEGRALAASAFPTLENGLVRLATFNLMADFYEGKRPDFAQVRGMARSIPGIEGVRLRAALDWDEFIVTVMSGENPRRLARPKTDDLPISITARLRMLRWAAFPADWYLAMTLGTYVVLTLAAAALSGG